MKVLTHFIQKRFVLILCASVIFITLAFHRKGWNTVLTSDGVGYYSYLPALFIYQDADYKFLSYFRENYQPVHEFIRDAHGEKVNQYFAGEAVLLLPFFLISHGIALLTHSLTDGFSPPYQVGVMLGGLFYFCWAIWLLSLVLKRFSKNALHIALSLFAIVWGTNLLVYSSLELCYSHLFSFWAFTVFFYGLVRVHESATAKNWFIAATGIAFITLIRPSNLLIGLTAPFFLQECITLDFVRRNIQKLLLAGVLVAGVLFIQPLAWYWQTYHWLVDAYTTAKFEFDKPHIREVLFSYQKGWWLYTPMALFSLFGLWRVFRSGYPGKYLLVLFLLLNIYIISSWNYWHYGATFSQRPFVESYGVHALLLLIGLDGITKKSLRWVVWFITVFLIFLNVFQVMQYRMNIIHARFMNKEVYWKVFLKMGEKYRFMTNTMSNPCKECSGIDSLSHLLRPDVSEVFEVNLPNSENDTTACLVLIGKLTSSQKNTDAYMLLELFDQDKLIGAEKVFMFRYLHESGADSLYHDIVLRKPLRKARQLRLSFHQWENKLDIGELLVTLRHKP